MFTVGQTEKGTHIGLDVRFVEASTLRYFCQSCLEAHRSNLHDIRCCRHGQTAPDLIGPASFVLRSIMPWAFTRGLQRGPDRCWFGIWKHQLRVRQINSRRGRSVIPQENCIRSSMYVKLCSCLTFLNFLTSCRVFRLALLFFMLPCG